MYVLYDAGETLPYIWPAGYNTTLGQDPVRFRCFVPSDLLTFGWLIDGKSLNEDREQTLEERGILMNPTPFTDDYTSYFVASVKASAENNNITLECVSTSSELVGARSAVVWLHIQGTHV